MQRDKMWRLHVCLLLSTCLLLPLDANPPAMRRARHIGRLGDRDLAQLLEASMQARGVQMTAIQEATMDTLQRAVQSEPQSGVVLVHVGMDVVIDMLTGERDGVSCGRIIRDIQHSMDSTSLTMSLKTFVQLCRFNGIQCTQKEVVQIIKSTSTANEVVSESGRSTRTASIYTSIPPVDTNLPADNAAVLRFLSGRPVSELLTIVTSLLQVCGLTQPDALQIVQALTQPKTAALPYDNGQLLDFAQIHDLITLIVNLLSNLTSIAAGSSSDVCAATPDNWIVRLLRLGVDKSVILGTLTVLNSGAMERYAGISDATNILGNTLSMTPGGSINGNDNTVNELIGANVPVLANVNVLNSITSGAITGNQLGGASGRSFGLGNVLGNTLIQGPAKSITGNSNVVSGLVDATVPVLANVGALNSVTSLVGAGGADNILGNKLVGGAAQGITGNNNVVNKLADLNVPVLASVGALNNVVGGGAPGSSGGVGNILGNTLTRGAAQGITGNNNVVNKLVDLNVPVLANVGALNNVANPGAAVPPGGADKYSANKPSPAGGAANILGNKLKGGPAEGINGNNNVVNKLVDANVPVLANVGALNSVTGLVGAGGADNILGNKLVGGAAQSISGNNNVVNKLVDLNVPVLASVGALNNVVGGGAAGSSGGVGNILGNTLTQGAAQGITGNKNVVNKLVDLNVPVLANVGALNNVANPGAALPPSGADKYSANKPSPAGGADNILGNKLNAGPAEGIKGNNNVVNKLVDANVPVLANVDALNNVLGTGGASSSGGVGNILGNTLTKSPTESITGNNNVVSGLVDATVPVLANVGALNSVTGIGSAGGAGGADNILGNKLLGGASQSITGNNNVVNKLVDLNLPVVANVDALNNVVNPGAAVPPARADKYASNKPSPASGADNILGNKLIGSPAEGITGNNNVVNKLVDANVPVLASVAALNNVVGGGAAGSSGGVGNILGNTLTQGGAKAITGDNNAINKLVDLNVPVVANVGALNSVTGLGGAGGADNILGNKLVEGATQGITGNNNVVNKLVDLNVPVLANVGALNNVVNPGAAVPSDGAGKYSANKPSPAGGADNILGNKLVGGAAQGITGNNNVVNKLVDLNVPVLANVDALNNVVNPGAAVPPAGADKYASNKPSPASGADNILGNKLIGGPAEGINGNNNVVNKLVDANVPVLANVGALNNVVGGGAAGSAGGVGNILGNTLTKGPAGSITGNNNVVSGLVNAAVPVLANVGALNNVVGAGGAGSSGVVGNILGNTLTKGPAGSITGNNNVVSGLVNAAVPVLANVGALNNVVGAGAADQAGSSSVVSNVLNTVTGGAGAGNIIGNQLTTGSETAIKGDNNQVVQFVDLNGNVLLNVLALTGVTGAGTGSVGNQLNKKPRQVVIGNNNKIVKLINVDADILATLNLANVISGGGCSGGTQLGNTANIGPDTVIQGDNNSITKLVDIDLALLPNLSLLNNIIGTFRADCTTAAPPPGPVTPATPVIPITYTTPATYATYSTSPTTAPTPKPVTLSPHNCYRRYCLKWRTRPSYLCHKKCGDPAVFKA